MFVRRLVLPCALVAAVSSAAAQSCPQSIPHEHAMHVLCSCYGDSFATEDTCDQFTVPTSCVDVLAKNPGTTDGWYCIRPPGVGDIISVYCDMSRDGGGWQLIATVDNSGFEHVSTTGEYLASPWPETFSFGASPGSMRKVEDAQVHAQGKYSAGKVTIRVDVAASVTVYYQWPAGGHVADFTCRGAYCPRMIISHTAPPYNWEAPSCVGTAYGYQINQNPADPDLNLDYFVFDGHDSSECGEVWISSQYLNGRALYSYAPTSGGIYNNQFGYTWMRPELQLGREVGSCKELNDLFPGLPSDSYAVTIDGVRTTVYCDMVTDGGGWTLIFSQNAEFLLDPRLTYKDGTDYRHPAATPADSTAPVNHAALQYYMQADLKTVATEIRGVNDVGYSITFTTSGFSGPLIFDASPFADVHSAAAGTGIIAGISPVDNHFQISHNGLGGCDAATVCRHEVGVDGGQSYSRGLMVVLDNHAALNAAAPYPTESMHFGGTNNMNSWASPGRVLYIR